MSAWGPAGGRRRGADRRGGAEASDDAALWGRDPASPARGRGHRNGQPGHRAGVPQLPQHGRAPQRERLWVQRGGPRPSPTAPRSRWRWAAGAPRTDALPRAEVHLRGSPARACPPRRRPCLSLLCSAWRNPGPGAPHRVSYPLVTVPPEAKAAPSGDSRGVCTGWALVSGWGLGWRSRNECCPCTSPEPRRPSRWPPGGRYRAT